MAESPKKRDLALKLLREKGHLALREVEKLLGWEQPFGMLQTVMAARLGIGKSQLKRLIQGQHLKVREKEQRRSKRDARTIALVPQISKRLGFSISLPPGWRVISDTEEIVRLTQEFSELMQQSRPERTPRHRVIFPRRGRARGIRNVIDLTDRLQARREWEERKEDAERHARLERMTVGLFQAAPLDNRDELIVEVIKWRLESPMTAMDLYSLDKHLPEAVPWGNRPSKGLVVDGLQGVLYYFAMNAGNMSATQVPAFFNVYLTEQLEGWLISCQCRCGEHPMKTFQKYKPIYRRIISSFRRS
jgi:hypothetical protein